MVYLKSLLIAVGIVYLIGSWVNWVGESDEHLFRIMNCMSDHKDVSRQEAVYLCEREVR
jgi:hypothetical protein